MTDQSRYPAALDDDATLPTAREGPPMHLTAPAAASDTTLTVDDTTGQEVPAIALIAGELIGYTGTTPTTLTGCERGLYQADGGWPPVAHASGSLVRQATTATSAVLRRVGERIQNDALREMQAVLGPNGTALRSRSLPIGEVSWSAPGSFGTNGEFVNWANITYLFIDLTGCTEFNFQTVVSTPGPVGATVYARYLPFGGILDALFSDTLIDFQDATYSMQDTGWLPLPMDARTVVQILVAAEGGDGVTSPYLEWTFLAAR